MNFIFNRKKAHGIETLNPSHASFGKKNNTKFFVTSYMEAEAIAGKFSL